MITIIQGTPGSGKSSVATVDMLEFLMSGGAVACNYNLIPNWHYKLADLNTKVKWGFKDRDEVARSYWDRAFRIGTADTIFELSDRLKDITTDYKGTNALGEGRGRLYLDESQLLFNSRNWKDNYEFIEFFTQHRKLGWDVYLIAHTADMIDKQIRGLIEYETRLRNMQKVKILGLFPVTPFPTFLAITRYAGISAGAGQIAYRRAYTLRKAYSSLYDSMEVFAFNASSKSVDNQGPLNLPRNPMGLGHNCAPASVLPQYHKIIRPEKVSCRRYAGATPFTPLSNDPN